MLVVCVICRKNTPSWRNVTTDQIGMPAIAIKDLLIKCFESPDALPNNIGENTETASMCLECEKKLLEFYEAVLQVAVKRLEFKKLVKNSEINSSLTTLQNTDDSIDFLYSDDGTTDDDVWADDWETEKQTKFIDEKSISDKEDEESIAALKSKLQDDKANRYCKECEVECPSEEVLKLHIKKVHKQEMPRNPFVCKTCQKTFKTYSQLTSHDATHIEPTSSNRIEKSTQCDECGHIFSNTNLLNKHKIVHTDVRNYKCAECDKSFRSSSHLKRHKLTHSGVKSHICFVCNKTFAQKYNLKSHMRQMHYKPDSSKESHKNIESKKCKPHFEDLELLNINNAEALCFPSITGPQPNSINLCNQFNVFN